MAKAQYNPLTFQVTLIVLALAAFSLAIVVGFGFFATLEADRVSLEKQKAFVAAGIADEMAEVVRQQKSVTEWDDSILAARRGDQAWMAENLGEWMHAYYGLDRVYVLDAAGRPVHAMRDGGTLAPSAYEDDRPRIEPFVEKLRALMKGAAAADDPPPLVASDIVSFGGAPAIIAVQPIVPSSDRVAQDPGTEYVHVSVQFVNGEVVDRIASQYQLRGAHMLPQQLTSSLPGASIPLMGSNGVILGYIAWNQDRPGLTLIREASPALIGFALLAAGVLWFLLGRLRGAAGELQRTQDQAQYLAFHDTLTGLPNRALFEDRLKRALLAVARDNRRIGLLYIDLDRFKTVNDTFGHPCGDELVRQAAARLEKAVRKVDTVARLGGDEFAVIVFDIKDLGTAEELCQRLLGEIGKPFSLLGNQVFVGASIGVAISSGPDTDPDDLLRKADIALYEAKKAGGGRHQIFASDMDDLLRRKRMIESDLRAALTGGDEVKLLYQPIYAPDCITVVGAEALIRWDHPVHGVLSPAHFVSIAEERGMTGLLGDWVLREAVRFAATSDLPWIAVNMSPHQLRNADFPDHVLSVLREAGVPPSRIQIEIVESALLENSRATGAVLAELRAGGVSVALDDFGTGYSSINYLQRHVIDKLKIDRSFVKTLGGSDGSSAIVRAIVALATAMRMKVTAEGVETPEQRDLLIRMGCHELQGFLLSPPLEASEIRALGAPHRREALQSASRA
ncbi:EAL domain-containing protein [Mesorhizobium sp. KR9-304]|uniref:putative bifunctional diguanylate cyclase/phosphodiesterase n=1 Tax=Mesorhizobium sp. KR9-304 TaxID=3156614 RepID=UPI0032B425BD